MSHAKADLKTVGTIIFFVVMLFLQYVRFAVRYDLPFDYKVFDFAKPTVARVWNKLFFSDPRSMESLSTPGYGYSSADRSYKKLAETK